MVPDDSLVSAQHILKGRSGFPLLSNKMRWIQSGMSGGE